jgi:hypothetical protein
MEVGQPSNKFLFLALEIKGKSKGLIGSTAISLL